MCRRHCLRPLALAALLTFPACADGPTAPGLRGPDGVLLVMRIERDGYELYAALPDGSKEIRLTSNDVDDLEPDWSPDGRRIVFVTARDTVNGRPVGRGDLWVMAPDGSGQRRLFADTVSSQQPRWSPDGRRIVFTRHYATAPNFRLAMVNADGSGVLTLLADVNDQRWPDWSPDGTRIVFLSGDAIHVVGADGTGAHQLSTAAACPTQIYSSPRWSPDGTRITYTCAGQYGVYLAVMNADGTQPVALTPDGSPVTYASDDSPVWSPDGTRIAFSSARDGSEYQMWTIPAAGGAPTQITQGQLVTFPMAWGPRR
jgi:Tol biopolymer transport system component